MTNVVVVQHQWKVKFWVMGGTNPKEGVDDGGKRKFEIRGTKNEHRNISLPTPLGVTLMDSHPCTGQCYCQTLFPPPDDRRFCTGLYRMLDLA
jgi:hypothetical protein